MKPSFPVRNLAWLAAAALLVAGATAGVLMSAPGSAPRPAPQPKIIASAPHRPLAAASSTVSADAADTGKTRRVTTVRIAPSQDATVPPCSRSRPAAIPARLQARRTPTPRRRAAATDAVPVTGSVICIDPGHPSETSEGASDGGLSENTLNWQVALRLKAHLDTLGIASIMTKAKRTPDGRRTGSAPKLPIARRPPSSCACIATRGGGHGFTWYYPDRTGRKDGVSGPPVSIQRASRAAAQVLNEAMKPLLRGSLDANPVLTDAATFVGGKQGGVLTGSIFARVPTALIEMCFINQRNDARFIASDAGQEKMAGALAEGIRRYLERDGRG